MLSNWKELIVVELNIHFHFEDQSYLFIEKQKHIKIKMIRETKF